MPFCYEKTGYQCDSFFEMLRDMRNLHLLGNENQRKLVEGIPLWRQVDMIWELYTEGQQKFNEEDARVYQAFTWALELMKHQ
jgi:hypothetical protein